MALASGVQQPLGIKKFAGPMLNQMGSQMGAPLAPNMARAPKTTMGGGQGFVTGGEIRDTAPVQTPMAGGAPPPQRRLTGAGTVANPLQASFTAQRQAGAPGQTAAQLGGAVDLTPQGAPPLASGVPGGATQRFGPGSNLIGTQFNPTASGRLQGTQGQVNQAQANVAGFQPGQFQGIQAGTAPGGLDQARQNIGQAQLGQFGAIEGPQFGGARNLLGQAGQETAGATVGPFAGIGTGQFGSQADTAAARAGISQDLGALRGGPSRGELAAQAFEQIQERGAPQFQRELRDVGARAASLGRVGAGVTTNELTDVFTQRQRDLDLSRRGLATEAAGLERGDLLNTLGASQSVGGQLFGQDVGEAGFQQGLRGEARGERGFQAGQAGQEAQRALQRANLFSGLGAQEAGLAGAEQAAQFGERGFQAGQDRSAADLALSRGGMFAGIQGQQFGQEQGLRGEARGERGAEQEFGLRNLGAQQNILGQLGGLEGQQFGQEQSQRNELRGERGFQTALDQQNIQNRVQQRQLEEALLSGQFGRDFSQQQLMAQIGFNPAAQRNFGQQAGQFSQSFGNQANASNQAAADLIRSQFNQQPFNPTSSDPSVGDIYGGRFDEFQRRGLIGQGR